jgi:phenylacetate 2-hydroxylase
LVSGGFETIPATLTSCIGSLSTKDGQAFQEQAYQDITRHYSGSMEEAWLASFAEEKVPYVNALVKEAGRYYTASAMNLPRKTTAPVAWDVATIPAKTMIIVTANPAYTDPTVLRQIR